MKISAKVGDRVFEVVVGRTDGAYEVEVDGKRHVLDAHKLEGDFYSIVTDGRSYEVSVEPDGDGYHVRHGASKQWVSLSDPSRQAREAVAAKGPLSVITQMPGRVVRLLVAEGDEVEEGQGVVVVEAMKMENELKSPRDGVVKNLSVEEGAAVEGGIALCLIE